MTEFNFDAKLSAAELYAFSMRHTYKSMSGIFGLIISFLGRIVFVKILTDEYLGLNSLFTNILTMLSLVELGVGSAIVYSLYKPLAVNDKEKIKSLMH